MSGTATVSREGEEMLRGLWKDNMEENLKGIKQYYEFALL